MYFDSKAPWYEITDSLPQFALRSPDTKPRATRKDEQVITPVNSDRKLPHDD